MARILLVKCAMHEGALTALSFPLGLMYLAAALRRRSDTHEVEILDLRVNGEDYTELAATVTRFTPHLVGLSAMSMEAPSMELAARVVRSAGFDGVIVAGGPHPTAFPEEALSCADIDLLVLGEGEETFIEIVEALDAGRPIDEIPGVARREGDVVVRSPARPPIADVDGIAPPAFDLLNLDRYMTFRSMSGVRSRRRFMNIFTSRSCPYRCAYCYPMFGKGFRPRSPRNVLEEVKHLVDNYNIDYFEIIDDIFNYDLDRAKTIIDLFQSEGLDIDLAFPSGLRCDRIDREFLEKLSRFDHVLLCVPVDSAAPRIQRMVRRNLDLEHVREIIDICADLRIYTRGYFMLGFPTETEEEMRRTIAFAVESRLHAAFFFAVVPFKGTELYDLCSEELRQRNLRPIDHAFFRTPINVSAAPDNVLFGLQRWAYVRMALSPTRIYRVFRDFPNLRFVWAAVKTLAEQFFGAGKGFRAPAPRLLPDQVRQVESAADAHHSEGP